MGGESIHQSISNEGKNWSKSSRWKSCSAWGGLSSLPVSRVSGFLVLLCTTAPQQDSDCYHTGAVILKYLHLLHFLCSQCFSHAFLKYPHTTFSKYFIHHQGQIQKSPKNNGCLSFTTPLLTTHNCQHRTVNPTSYLTHSPSSSAVCYYALTLFCVHEKQ